jgi:hypothetical protein
MSRFLDTIGKSTLGIGICDRCRKKFSLTELYSDPNSPGLKVCRDCIDDLDPYRLPPRPTETVNLPFVRPDVNLDQEDEGDFVPSPDL